MLRYTLRFNQTRSFSYSRTLLFPSAAAEASDKPVKKRKSREVKEPGIQKDVLKYFSNFIREEALEFPSTILTKTKRKNVDGYYIADPVVVDSIAEVIKKDLPEDKLIFEVNPGLGMLTKKLIKETKNPLVLCESDKICYEKLSVSLNFINYFYILIFEF